MENKPMLERRLKDVEETLPNESIYDTTRERTIRWLVSEFRRFPPPKMSPQKRKWKFIAMED